VQKRDKTTVSQALSPIKKGENQMLDRAALEAKRAKAYNAMRKQKAIYESYADVFLDAQAALKEFDQEAADADTEEDDEEDETQRYRRAGQAKKPRKY
jgi:hypothetical protein